MNRQQAQTTTTQHPAHQQSDPCCYKFSGPMVDCSRVNQCDQHKEDEIHRRQSLHHHDQPQSRMPTRSGSCYKYSGPIVQNSYVDQCEQASHLPQNEQTDKWQPLGLDHQSGYTYLYQHSGFECAEKEEEKQAAARAREQHS
ncbi:hypothetical protein [Absidia glauca]|uniref:Uncharacterized protein n=1 Tax=Absidia glauca TaxID=4829 RepID=A0A163JB44_ABSGL|nr:hypothetical protein [Absidia glauca]